MKKGLNNIVVRRNNVSVRRYAQGTAILAFDIGQAFEVDEIGAEILHALETLKHQSELVDLLSKKYKASPRLIAKDVEAFLNDCNEFGVIEELPDDVKRE